MKNYLIICLVGVIGILAYSPFSLLFRSFPTTQHTPFAPKEQVIVTAKAYTPNESKYFLFHDLISRGVQPIHISIENNSSREYSLCASSVDLPHLDPKEAAFKVTRSAIPRAIAYRVASLLFWPFSLPSTIDGLRTYSHHRMLKADYRAKALKERGEVVAPYSTFHRILFVPKNEMQRSFAVTLIDIETLEQFPHEIESLPS